MLEEPSYYALRVCPDADTPLWWAIASAHAARAPAALRPILDGRRRRVELDAQAATAVLAWARAIDGWPSTGPTPVWIYPAAPDDTTVAAARDA
jgi:hypothetical protein